MTIDRFAGRAGRQRAQKIPPLRHLFNVQRHHLRLGVFGQILQEIPLVQVGAVAVTDEFGDPQAVLSGPGQKDPADRAALGDEGDGTRRGTGLQGGEKGVVGVDDPRAVGADDPDAGPPDDLANGFLPGDVADFREPGGDDDGGAHSGPRALLQHGGDRPRRGDDDGQVHRPADFRHRRVARDAQRALAFGIDHRQARGREPAFQHLAEQVVSQFPLADRADEGHCSGGEECRPHGRLMENHEDTKTRRIVYFVPSCLCGFKNLRLSASYSRLGRAKRPAMPPVCQKSTRSWGEKTPRRTRSIRPPKARPV